MVRLASSRIHRCYSRRGGQSSARNERFTGGAHLCACLLLFISHSHFLLPHRNPHFADFAVAAGGLLLVAVSLSDLQATFTAHKMFYKWSKSGKLPSGFWSTPTKVDAAISFLYLFGSMLFTATTIPFVKKSDEGHLSLASVASSGLLVAGGMINIVASIPSLEFRVPGGVARAQNMVVMLFFAGAIGRLTTAVTKRAVGTGDVRGTFLERMSLFADSLVLLGALFNYVRALHLLRTVNHWASDGNRGVSDKPQRGLLSWFKSSRSSPEMSDYESDIEEIGFDTDEDGHAQFASRRSTWSRM